MASRRIRVPMFYRCIKKKVMIHEFNKPIPVVVENNIEGYAIYVESSGMFENDCWTVVHCDSGIVRHYLTDQIKIYQNLTYSIIKNDNTNNT